MAPSKKPPFWFLNITETYFIFSIRRNIHFYPNCAATAFLNETIALNLCLTNSLIKWLQQFVSLFACQFKLNMENVIFPTWGHAAMRFFVSAIENWSWHRQGPQNPVLQRKYKHDHHAKAYLNKIHTFRIRPADNQELNSVFWLTFLSCFLHDIQHWKTFVRYWFLTNPRRKLNLQILPFWNFLA